MKKTLWTMAAALALVGCSQDDLLNVENTPVQELNAVAFGTYVGDNAQSRATVVTTETLGGQGFGVNAYYTGQEPFSAETEYSGNDIFMTNTKVTFNPDKGENGAWTYSPLKYWPNNDGDKVSFFAYGPYSKNTADNNITQNGTDLNFTVHSDVKQQVDLIYNTNYEGTVNQEKPAVESKINFNFSHALSRVSFTVEAAVDEIPGDNKNNLLDGNTRINVKKVALVGDAGYEEGSVTGPFYTGGTLSLLEPGTETDEEGNEVPVSPWTIEEGINTQGFVFDATNFYHTVQDKDTKEDVVQLTRFNASEPQRLLNDSSYLMIIPQNDVQFSIYIEYDVISEGNDNDANGDYDSSTISNKITKEIAQPIDFEIGRAYNFNLVLGMTSVKFEAKVAEWGEEIDGGTTWLPDNETENEEDGLEPTNLVYNNNHQILIKNASDLAEARDLINGGYPYEVNYYETDDEGNNKVYKVIKASAASTASDEKEYTYFYEADYLQEGDVDLTDIANWIPIGTSSVNFTGRFEVSTNDEGEYYTISNLTITECSDVAGLFGYVTGHITDIRMTNVSIGTEDSPVTAGYAAAIAGYGGELTGCIVESGSIYGVQVAGLVAGGHNSFFTSCKNAATVCGSGKAAGIYAGSSGSIYDCENTGDITSSGDNAAGITMNTVSITNARNSGDISGYNNVGGIVAAHEREDSEVIASVNSGNITSENGSAGGIVGLAHGANIEACYNTASNIIGTKVGGIVGYWSVGGIDENSGITATMTACYSTTETLNGSEASGVLCGGTYKGSECTITYTACYYANCESSETIEGVTKIDETSNTWTSAIEVMNALLTDWEYSNGDGEYPVLGPKTTSGEGEE